MSRLAARRQARRERRYEALAWVALVAGAAVVGVICVNLAQWAATAAESLAKLTEFLVST